MRPIKQIIIHCTATPEGRPVSVADVTKWHLNRGFDGIGYHYLIGLNGEIWTGRALEKPGAHTTGQNQNSIGICYVGGCDRSMKPKDTRTTAQKIAMRKLVELLLHLFPACKIHGHNEYAAKACPSFDVQKWCKEIGL